MGLATLSWFCNTLEFIDMLPWRKDLLSLVEKTPHSVMKQQYNGLTATRCFICYDDMQEASAPKGRDRRPYILACE